MMTIHEQIQRMIAKKEDDILSLRNVQRMFQTSPEVAVRAFHVLNESEPRTVSPPRRVAQATIQRVTDFVAKNSPCNVKQVMDEVGMSRATIQKALTYGIDNGKIQRIGIGKYQAA